MKYLGKDYFLQCQNSLVHESMTFLSMPCESDIRLREHEPQNIKWNGEKSVEMI